MDKWLVIHTDQTYELVEQPKGQSQLEFLQGVVGGYIEIVYPPSNRAPTIVLDEEGKLKQKDPNLTASLIYRTGDLIAGSVILCGHATGELEPLGKPSVELVISTFNLLPRRTG